MEKANPKSGKQFYQEFINKEKVAQLNLLECSLHEFGINKTRQTNNGQRFFYIKNI